MGRGRRGQWRRMRRLGRWWRGPSAEVLNGLRRLAVQSLEDNRTCEDEMLDLTSVRPSRSPQSLCLSVRQSGRQARSAVAVATLPQCISESESVLEAICSCTVHTHTRCCYASFQSQSQSVEQPGPTSYGGKVRHSNYFWSRPASRFLLICG